MGLPNRIIPRGIKGILFGQGLVAEKDRVGKGLFCERGDLFRHAVGSLDQLVIDQETDFPVRVLGTQHPFLHVGLDVAHDPVAVCGGQPKFPQSFKIIELIQNKTSQTLDEVFPYCFFFKIGPLDLDDPLQLLLLLRDFLGERVIDLLIGFCQQRFDLADGKICGLQIFDLDKIQCLGLSVVAVH